MRFLPSQSTEQGKELLAGRAVERNAAISERGIIAVIDVEIQLGDLRNMLMTRLGPMAADVFFKIGIDPRRVPPRGPLPTKATLWPSAGQTYAVRLEFGKLFVGNLRKAG